jgi:hypothetical protein
VELNHHLVAAENDGGVCFPMGRGLYRVVHIPEDDFVLLNSREKAPYLICVEVLKCEANRFAVSFIILLFLSCLLFMLA